MKREWKLIMVAGYWFPTWSTDDRGFLTNEEAHIICDMRNAR